MARQILVCALLVVFALSSAGCHWHHCGSPNIHHRYHHFHRNHIPYQIGGYAPSHVGYAGGCDCSYSPGVVSYSPGISTTPSIAPSGFEVMPAPKPIPKTN